MFFRVSTAALFFLGFLASSHAEVRVPKVLDVVPAILPADISDGIQWSDGIKTQWGSSPDLADGNGRPAIPAAAAAVPADSAQDIDNFFQQNLDYLLKDYDYGPIFSAISSDEYYDNLQKELNYYDEDNYPDGFLDDIYVMKEKDFFDSLDQAKYPQDGKIPLADFLKSIQSTEDDSEEWDPAVYEDSDLFKNLQKTLAGSSEENDKPVPILDQEKAEPVLKVETYDTIYPDITGGDSENEDKEYQDQDQLQYKDSSAESDESSEENGVDHSDENPFDDIKSLYEDLFGSNDKTVRYHNIGRDIRFLELACYVGIFLGFILLTFGLFVCCVRILRFRGQPSSVDRQVLTPDQQVKNVKLSGIVKSYARIPVEIRNMKPSNVAYKELYNVV